MTSSTRDRLVELRAKQKFASSDDEDDRKRDKSDPLDPFYNDCEEIGVCVFVFACLRVCVFVCL